MAGRHIWEADPAMDLMLRALWKAGETTPVIANAMSRAFCPLTKNSIIGRVHRLGLPPRRGPSAPRQPRAERPPMTVSAPLVTIPEPEVIVMPEDVGPIRLLDTRNSMSQCRWPVDSGREPMCCVAPTVSGTSWCKSHLVRVSSPQPKKREAA